MATRVGPINNIVNVGWGNGIFLHIQADAIYDVGTFGTRTASIELLPSGLESGGRILGFRLIHQAEIANVSPATTRFRALLAFSKAPANDQRAAYVLKLGGAIKKTDTGQPPPQTPAFCGTQTTKSVYGPIFTQPTPGNPDVPQFFRQVTITNTSPGGSSSASYTQGPIADLSMADVGKGAYSISGTSNEIWYKDAFNNFVNTHRPCSELPPPDQPPIVVPLRVEGWSYIETQSWTQKFYTINEAKKEPATWSFDTFAGQIIIPTSPLAYGGLIIRTIVPQNIVGLNADLGVIFDDLPSADYEFSVNPFTFKNLKPIGTQKQFSFAGAYPLQPNYLVWNLAVAEPAPYRGYHPPKEQYPGTFSPGNKLEKRFPAGVLPDQSTSFVAF